MNNYKYVMEAITFLTKREITTDPITAALVFTALCDFYGIDEDEIDREFDTNGFAFGSATMEINDKQYTFTIKRI